MYVRQNRQLRNGRYVTYLSLAHNVKVDSPKGKRTKPIVFANLGNEDDLSYDVASGMVNALTRYVEKRWGKKPEPAHSGSHPTAIA